MSDTSDLSPPARQQAAQGTKFSGSELVVTLTIMVGLVGVVTQRAAKKSHESQAAHIVRLAADVRVASESHLEDTGVLPREYNGWESATFHRLAVDPGLPGWDGPYLEGSIEDAWNPSGGAVHLLDRIALGYTGGDGFDLDGSSSSNVVRRHGSMLALWDTPVEVAQRVDLALDGPSGEEWSSEGHVEFDAASGMLAILVTAIEAPDVPLALD